VNGIRNRFSIHISSNSDDLTVLDLPRDECAIAGRWISVFWTVAAGVSDDQPILVYSWRQRTLIADPVLVAISARPETYDKLARRVYFIRIAVTVGVLVIGETSISANYVSAPARNSWIRITSAN